MHPLAARALRTIRRHDLIPPGARVIAAVSGGSDSVAMLFLLRELEAAGELVCAGMAHVNHQLRGDGAARDQAYCAQLAARLELAIEIGVVDVKAIAQERSASIEDAARIGRYDFLERTMARLNADFVAVGHTRDDQAETFVLRMIRGAGSRGLRGIHPRRGVFFRPVLDATRAELRRYLDDLGIRYCDDESNADVTFMRNRVRHELMPLLRERFSPRVDDVFARNAEIATADDAYLTAQAAEVFAGVVRVDAAACSVTIDRPRLIAEPLALAWRVALEALRTTAGLSRPPARSPQFEHAQALIDLISGVGAARIDLPGVRAERIGPTVVLHKRTGRGARASGNPFQYPLSIPGEVWLREAGCVVAAQAGSAEEGRAVLAEDRDARRVAVVAAEALPPRLTVRSRRRGDAFRPLGLGGRKKLQDFLVDCKVGRERRDRVPLIVDDRDRIIWVAGHAISEEFRVLDGAQAVVILRLKEQA